MKPLLFGKYCLLERVSVGGMAEVFRAKPFDAPDFRGYLALKRILPHLAEDDEFIKMFVDEAKLTVQFNHPNIVRIYELGQFQQSYYILMEFISGKDVLALQKTMRRQRSMIPVDMAMFIAREMARGLHYAHHKRDPDGNPLNIIHRDVSPQNVLIDYRGRVKVIDFGIAKATIQSTRTAIGVLKGKMGYMSPEQVRGEVLDFRSDVFAIGTVLWEMLTNRRLFHAESEFETMQMVRDAVAQPPSSRNQGIFSDVDEIVMRALTRDPEQRYESAGAMADAIDAWLVTNPFTDDDLSIWMRTVYADDLDDERAKRDDFASIVSPEDVLRLQEEAAIEAARPEVVPEAIGLSEDSAAAIEDWSRPDMGEAVETHDPESGAWVGAGPGEGESIAEFADQHTTVAAGGFDASLIEDDSAEFDALSAPTDAETIDEPAREPAVHSAGPLPAVTGPMQAHAEPQLQPQQPQHTASEFKSEDTNRGRAPVDASPPKFFYVIAVISALLLIGGVLAATAAIIIEPEVAIPEPEATGSIVVTVTPASGIEIFVDGAMVSTTSPHQMTGLAAGAHRVEVKHPDHVAFSDDVSVAVGGTTPVNVSLEPTSVAPGFISLRLPDERAGLAIYVDGEAKEIDPTKNPTFELAGGEHLVEAVQPGFRPWSKSVNVESRARREERVTLVPATIEFKVRADPQSHVTFGDQRLGRGIVTAVDVAPGALHRLSVVYRGQGVSSWKAMLGLPILLDGEIEVDFDKPTPKQYAERDYGFLQISTGDSWWEIMINGKDTHLVTPIDATHKLPILPGKHTLTLKRGGVTHEKPIEILRGETLIWREKLAFSWSPAP